MLTSEKRLLIKQKIKQFFSNKTIVFCLLFTFFHFLAGFFKYIEILQGGLIILAFVILPIQSALNVFLYIHCFTFSALGGRYPISFIILLSVFVIVITIKYIIGAKKKVYPVYKPLLIAISVFVAFYLSISFFCDIYAEAFCYIGYFFLAYFFLAMKKEFNVKQLMNYLTAGLIVSCILALVSIPIPHYIYEAVFDGTRFNAFLHHPNYLYMIALLVLTYNFYRYLTHNLSSLNFVAIYAVCAMIVLSTLSKTGIVLLVFFSLLFFVLFLKENFKKRIIIGLIILLTMAIIALICHKFVFALIDRFRVNNGDIINSLLTGRDDIWIAYLKKIVENPFRFLFGYGLVAEEVFVPSQHMTRASHNLFLFLFYRFGLLGVIALMVIAFIFVKCLDKKQVKFVSCLPILWYLVQSLFDNTFKPYNFIFLFLSVMIMFMDAKDSKSECVTEKSYEHKAGKL